MGNSVSSRPQRRQRTGWLRRLIGDVLFVARRDKKWWLLPLICLLLLLAALLMFAATLGPRAPLI
jgi:hypothetical protein